MICALLLVDLGSTKLLFKQKKLPKMTRIFQFTVKPWGLIKKSIKR